jgi:sec-independent protein translocase protein TatC
MPFLDHLEELRWRILRALVALIAGVVAAFSLLLRFDIILILERPILPF